MSKYTIAKYIRLSMEDAKYDSMSISNQQLVLDRHIDSLNIPDAEVLEFIDNGYTGLNFERPGVQELLDLVRQSKIDCIVVKDFSRFGRSSIETGYFIEMVFPLFQTRFISIADGFDSDEHKGDTGGMEVAFKFLMHEYYSQDLSRKEKTAKYAKMKRGEYQSVICSYGFRKGENGRLEIDEEAATVVKLIFDLAITMKNCGDIVKALHDRKIPPPGEYRKAKGIGFHDVSRSIGIWSRSTILRIIQDERYIGTYIMGKRAVTEIGGSHVRLKPESEWFKIPDHHPAIVSRDVYEQANAQIRHFKCPKTPREYTLRAKVYCGCCRHAMNLAPRKVRAFVCRYTKVDENAECHRLEIGEQALEDMLFEIIRKQAEIVLATDSFDDISEVDVKIHAQVELEKQLELRRKEKQGLYEQLILGELDAKIYKERKARMEAKISRLIRNIETHKTENAAKSLAKAKKGEMQNMISAVSDSNELTRSLVDMFIDKIYIYPGNHVEINWKVAEFN